LELKTLHKLNI